MINNFILEKYIQTVMDIFFLSPSKYHKKIGGWSFRCNICGDSKKSKKKQRAHIFKKDDIWFFKCFNCDYAISAEKWLKIYFSEYYRMYLYETASLKNHKITNDIVQPSIVQEENKYNETKDVKSFRSINIDSELSRKAIEYCKSRKIPENVWKKWFVASEGTFKNRLIIPFYDKNNKIYYWQGRTLIDQEPKYLNRCLNKDNIIYNIDFIDKNLPVIVQEGVIDSLFVENGISPISKNWSENINQIINNLNAYYLLDNDESGKLKSLKLLELNKYVFLWEKYLKTYSISCKIKDINNLYIKLGRTEKFNFNELKPYFSNCYYDKAYLI